MSRWRNLAHQAAERLVDYVFHRPGWPIRLLGAGVTLIVGGLGIGGLAGDLTWMQADQVLRLAVHSNGGGLSVQWSQIAVCVGLALLLVGIVLGSRDHIVDRRQAGERRVVVIEHRGLHQTVDTPLADAVPRRVQGHVDAMPIDHRQVTSTSHIGSPEDALFQIAGLRQQLRQKRQAVGPKDIKLVYGGMAPVPLTFLTGMMIDNEADLIVMDWDRFESRWRELDGADDGERLNIVGLDELTSGTTEVAVAVAISYPSDIESIRSTLGDIPLVRASLTNLSTSNHWSGEKQAALAKDFTGLLGKLLANEITFVHLFIAAPNSVVFNLGRHYDDRLHPDAVVYQYERSALPPFPWAIRLPTHGRNAPTIVKTKSRHAN